MLFSANVTKKHETTHIHVAVFSYPPKQCDGIQNDYSELLAPTPSQELFGRVLIDLGQNHSKASANNLAIYMTD